MNTLTWTTMPRKHCCPITRGRHLYERWLWMRNVSPDDLWDYLDEDEQSAWEQLAFERADTLTPLTQSYIHQNSGVDVVIAADRYARMPSFETREAFKAELRGLIHALVVQRDFAVEVAAELTDA